MRSVDVACTNNAVPYQLRNGSVLMAGTCGSSHPSLPGADGEQITLSIADKNNFFGPFTRIPGQGFGGSLWKEDEPGEILGPRIWSRIVFRNQKTYLSTFISTYTSTFKLIFCPPNSGA